MIRSSIWIKWFKTLPSSTFTLLNLDVNEKILKGVTSDFLQQATSATSKEQILQQATGHFKWVTSSKWISTSKEQRVESYASID